jgi:hypothetical protein
MDPRPIRGRDDGRRLAVGGPTGGLRALDGTSPPTGHQSAHRRSDAIASAPAGSIPKVRSVTSRNRVSRTRFGTNSCQRSTRRSHQNLGGFTGARVRGRIQSRQAQVWAHTGNEVRGHKIGLASRAMQEQMGVDQPDYGHLMARMFHPEH